MNIHDILVQYNGVLLRSRTPGTGLYDNLQKYKLDYPQQIFGM